MNPAIRALSLMSLYCAVSGIAVAQQQATAPAATPASPSVKPAKATAQSEAGDPRADTSNSAARSAAPSAAPAPSTATAPSTGRARSAVATPSAGRPVPGPASVQKSISKIDRLELGTATVTGDREQPKVMYIVPWKRSDIGDLAGKPMNSLVDEILAPVDRDVFKREVVYYHAVQADASQNGAPAKPAQQGEK
jgi:hypothetical protein